MSGSDSDENYSKHQHKKHKRRESSSDSYRECKKKHKNHKRRSNDRHYDQKRRKLKEESKDYVKVKSEPKDRREKKLTRTEAREKDSSQSDNRLQSPESATRHACPDDVPLRMTKDRESLRVGNFVETPNNEISEDFRRSSTQDKRLPEDLKTEIEELLHLGVDKDKLCDYVQNVTKKSVDRKILCNISQAIENHRREISRDRALVLIKKVYAVETEEESEEIFQQLLLMNKPAKRVMKQEPEELAGDVGVTLSNKRKKEVKVERHNRGRFGDSRSEAEGAGKRGKSTKTAGGVEKPNFSLSGKLAEDTNICNGVVVKYSEPPEARMPKKRWRLYPFKGDQGLPTLYIHRQSAYLLGRDRKVADIPIDHPSCSKQHAALQYRLVTYQRADGSTGKQIRLYIIDLESANGTYINNNKIEPRKYVELFEKDVIKFGFSSREYVLLHEHSKDNDESENES